MPAEASTYAVPGAGARIGLRRFGFHGLSVQWAAERVPVPRLVVCHLGGGCSVTAVRDGRSVDTTMGFTPLEGVAMATRSGSVDPGLLLYLLRHGLSVDELERGLEEESGLLGLSGRSPHVQELEEAMAAGDDRAGLRSRSMRGESRRRSRAWLYPSAGSTHWSSRAASASTPGGCASTSVTSFGFLGVDLDAESTVRVLVVESREDVVIARAARRAVGR